MHQEIQENACTLTCYAQQFELVKFVNFFSRARANFLSYSMFLSAWLTSTWFLLQSVNLIRESALQRAYILIWLYSIGWLVMVAATIGEDHFQLGSAYLLVIYFAAIFAALLVSYIEFFALPRKTEYVEDAVYHGGQTPTRHSSIFTGGRHADDQDADETTSLLRGEPPSRFTRYRRGRRVHNGPEDVVEQHPHLAEPFGKEQAWSGSLPSWTWLIQFILLAPIVVILVGQVALLYASAITQTPADGSKLRMRSGIKTITDPAKVLFFSSMSPWQCFRSSSFSPSLRSFTASRITFPHFFSSSSSAL